MAAPRASGDAESARTAAVSNNTLDPDFRDLERLLAFGKELGRMGTWEVSYDENGEPRTRWSDECWEIFGIADRGAREGTIDGFLDRVHRFDVDRVRAVVKRRQEPGPMPELEFRVVRDDSTQCWVALRGEVDENGRVIGIVQDVTEQREAKEELARNDQGLKALFASSRDGLIVFNDVMRIVDVNPAAADIYGRSREELLGVQFGRLTRADDGDDRGGRLGYGDWDALDRFRGGEVQDHRRVVDRPDGTVRVIETTGIPNFLGGGLHLAVLRDVTSRERHAQELKAAEARYRSLVEEMPLVTYILSPTRSPLYISPQVETLLGHEPVRWTGDPYFHMSVVHPDDRVRLGRQLAEYDGGEPLEAEYRLTRPDGRDVWVLDRMAAVRDERGELLCYQGFLLDVSHRKDLEEQLQQSQRMETIGRLAGGVAHDFNNLLTAITGYSNFALERLELSGGNDRLRHDIEQIRKSAERAASLTQQLLAFSRRQVLQPRTLELNGLVRDVRGLLERLIGDHVELATSLCDELYVSADPGRLEQVLVNLAVNARDAMPDGGTLSIEAATVEIEPGHAITRWSALPGRYATLVVRDTGHGMDAHTLAHVFEPFFTTKDVGLGTGLGLSTVYGIVKQSGGWITLDSEPGGGTTATIYLPRVESVVPVSEEPAAEPAAGSGRILLVEDEPVVRGLVAQMLEARGYDVVEAEGPLEALELTDVDACDLLLTDVVMPKMNGRELARRIRARTPSLHVVYTSGYAPEAVLDGGRLDAGEFFLQKPFTAADLGSIVREALDAAAVAST
jgi:PAS domain S-box-containing protein